MELIELYEQVRERLAATDSISNGSHEADLVFRHRLGLEPATRIAFAHGEVGPQAVASVEEVVVKREQGLPLAYALERAEFYGLTFEVGPEVLIPRSETEFLVAQGDKWIKENRFKYKGLENGIQLLDLGCGSGCVGIALAHLHPTVKATLTDVSAPALEYAHENAKRHQVLERCDFRTGDWFSVLKRRERFHIILCNPPYVTDRDDPALAQAVKEHEPSLALFLDEDPQEFYFRLARKAVSHLYSGGMFAVEVGYDTAWPARCALNKVNALTRGREVHDFIGLERVIWGIRR